MVLRIDGLVGRIDIAKIAAESVFQVVKAGLNVGLGSLQKGLDRTVGAVPHKTGQVVTARRTLGGIAKTNALNSTGENDLFGSLIHRFPRPSTA